MLPMCSELSRPTRVNVSPPSVDLYTPSPYVALRGFEFSPVPSQTMSEFFGSITTQHMLNEPPLSNTECHVLPRLSLFQSPPTADATKYLVGLFGSTSTSATRPVLSVGPSPRSSRPLNPSAVIRFAPPCPRPAATARTTNIDTKTACTRLICVTPKSACLPKLRTSDFELQT